MDNFSPSNQNRNTLLKIPRLVEPNHMVSVFLSLSYWRKWQSRDDWFHFKHLGDTISDHSPKLQWACHSQSHQFQTFPFASNLFHFLLPQIISIALDRSQNPGRHPKRNHCFLYTEQNDWWSLYIFGESHLIIIKINVYWVLTIAKHYSKSFTSIINALSWHNPKI